uniref:Uncharacterized protein n=1 Tax=Lepeophtheirus salmonis TaxID=72036 RepID=A0A0K2UL21_LEPSM
MVIVVVSSEGNVISPFTRQAGPKSYRQVLNQCSAHESLPLDPQDYEISTLDPTARRITMSHQQNNSFS